MRYRVSPCYAGDMNPSNIFSSAPAKRYIFIDRQVIEVLAIMQQMGYSE